MMWLRKLICWFFDHDWCGYDMNRDKCLRCDAERPWRWGP